MTFSSISNRDGIVGPASEPTWLEPPHHLKRRQQVDDAESLADWEPWVRGSVLDVELLNGLDFARTPVSGNESISRGFELHRQPSLLDAHKAPAGSTCLIQLKRPKSESGQNMAPQLQLVMDYADLRLDRQAEILSQIPQLMSYWTTLAGLHPSRTRWTLELLNLAIRLAISVEVRFKHALALPRPVQYSPQIQPMLLTPGHSSFPSGHSTEAHCVAVVLMALRGASSKDVLGQQLLRQAARIAINRTVAGVHFPIDSWAGKVLGTTLADYLVQRCGGQGSGLGVWARAWDAQDHLKADFAASPELHDMYPQAQHPGCVLLDAKAPVKCSTSPLLQWLWKKARAEWSIDT